MRRRLAEYVQASTANPTGVRPWGFKLGAYDPRERYLSAYYQANFAVPSTNEVGARLAGMGATFNKPGGQALARWATKDNFNAPLPVYGAPELIPGHYSSRLGIMTPQIATNGGGTMRAAPYGSPIYVRETPWIPPQNSPQPIVVNAGAPQTTLPQPTLTPATVAATPTAAVSSSGAPISSGTPASTVATPAVTPGSLQDLWNQSVAYLQRQTILPGMPNYVPVGAGAALLLFFFFSNKGRR